MSAAVPPVDVGIIGGGKIAERHLAAYDRLPGVAVTVTDIDERGRELAERHGVGWHPDPEELIAAGGVEAIDVCVPTHAHAALIFSALDAGKHVFVEKPMARDLAEATAIAERAAASGAVVMAGYLYRYHPAMQFARDVLRDGALGRPHLATFRVGGRGSHQAWKHRSATGGGAGNEMLVHMLDLALWLFGEPASVANLYTDVLLPRREIAGETVAADAEDVVLLGLRTAEGVQVLCQSDLVTPGYMNHVEIQGANGSLMTSILDYMPTTLFCREPAGGHPAGRTFTAFPEVDLFERELRHFLECVRGGDRSAIHSVEDSLRVMRIVDAALSARRPDG